MRKAQDRDNWYKKRKDLCPAESRWIWWKTFAQKNSCNVNMLYLRYVIQWVSTTRQQSWQWRMWWWGSFLQTWPPSLRWEFVVWCSPRKMKTESRSGSLLTIRMSAEKWIKRIDEITCESTRIYNIKIKLNYCSRNYVLLIKMLMLLI